MNKYKLYIGQYVQIKQYVFRNKEVWTDGVIRNLRLYHEDPMERVTVAVGERIYTTSVENVIPFITHEQVADYRPFLPVNLGTPINNNLQELESLLGGCIYIYPRYKIGERVWITGQKSIWYLISKIVPNQSGFLYEVKSTIGEEILQVRYQDIRSEDVLFQYPLPEDYRQQSSSPKNTFRDKIIAWLR